MLPQKSHHVVRIHVFEWGFTGGVMAARQDHGFQVGAVFPEASFSLPGELRQEREIVTRVDQQVLLGIARKLIEICHGAHALP